MEVLYDSPFNHNCDDHGNNQLIPESERKSGFIVYLEKCHQCNDRKSVGHICHADSHNVRRSTPPTENPLPRAHIASNNTPCR